MAGSPRRVVSTFLCTDEYAYRLLPPDHIAALSYLAGDKKPVVSTIADRVDGFMLIHPSAEAVLSLKPDLVLLYQGTNPRLKAQLEVGHVPFVEVAWANSLAEIRSVTEKLGAELGAPDKAKAMLARMDTKLKKARAVAARPPVSALLFEPNGYAMAGTVTQELMQVAGLRDAAGRYRLSRTGRVALEALVADSPQLVILGGHPDRANAEADMILHHPALDALKDRTLMAWASMTGGLCPGPWSADMALRFAALGQKATALARGRSAP
jgi:iron complex transport system substrate-binding protein